MERKACLGGFLDFAVGVGSVQGIVHMYHFKLSHSNNQS